LKNNEEKLQKLISNISDVIVILDNNGIITYKSSNITKQFGWAPDELIGRHSLFTVHPDDKKRVGDSLTKIFKQDSAIVQIEYNYFCKDGSYKPVELIAVNMVNDPVIKGVLANYKDITQRIQATEELRKSEEKYRLAMEATTDGLWDWNIESGEVYYSPLWSKILGETDVAPKYESWADRIYSNDRQIVRSTLEDHLEGKSEIWQKEHRLRTKAGKWKWVLGRGRVVEISKGGQPLRMVGTMTDISDRKKMEDELRQVHKMESIGLLAGGIAHDFNNILGIIVGNTELALDDLPDWNPSYNNLKEIKIASLRAKDVVRQLLSFSRKTEQEQKPLDIIKVIKESIQLIRSSIPSSIEIREEIPEKIDTILADATQIHQVLINLCTNASHAMLDDEGLLEIILRSKVLNEKTGEIPKGLSHGNYVEMIVKDSGSGIDPKIYDKIFDPYFTTKDVGKGTGMGLAVVHGIVKNHKGKIYVDSELGKGTTFTIVFPTISEQAQQNTEELFTKSNPSGKETILFVDDEEALVDMAKMILEKLGYTVQISTNPMNALALFEADPTLIDLVISDMTMPQMSGVKLSEKLREIQNDIPIIICTGHSSLIDEEKAKDIGISAFAMKPITMSEIAKLIRTVLDE
jgi:PAS domain S-box-containing protein